MLSTRPLKMVNPPGGASEPRPRKHRVGRVPVGPRNETTEPPVHLCGDGGLECRGDQIGTRAPCSGIIAQISRGPGVRAILALPLDRRVGTTPSRCFLW